jgi:hypothetical protein
MLVAVAVVTTVLAAIALAGDDEPGTSIGASPALSLTVSPDAEATADADTTSAAPTPSPEPSTPSPNPPRKSPATASPAGATPINQILGLAAVLRQQADAGQVQPKAAKVLLRDLNAVAGSLSAGKTAEAAESFAQFRNRLTEFRGDGKLTESAFDALPDLGQIADSLDAG